MLDPPLRYGFSVDNGVNFEYRNRRKPPTPTGFAEMPERDINVGSVAALGLVELAESVCSTFSACDYRNPLALYRSREDTTARTVAGH